jgi:hypothetical protein
LICAVCLRRPGTARPRRPWRPRVCFSSDYTGLSAILFPPQPDVLDNHLDGFRYFPTWGDHPGFPRWPGTGAQALLGDRHPIHFSGFTLLGIGMTSSSSAITCIPLDKLHRWHVMARIELLFHCGCCRVSRSFSMWLRSRPAAADFRRSRTDPTRQTPRPGPEPEPAEARSPAPIRSQWARHTSSLNLNNKFGNGTDSQASAKHMVTVESTQ